MRFYNEPTTQEIRDAILARDAEQRAGQQQQDFHGYRIDLQPTGQVLPITNHPVSHVVAEFTYFDAEDDVFIYRSYGDNGWQRCVASSYHRRQVS